MGVNFDFQPVMRPVFKAADSVFGEIAKRQAIITSGRDREHSPGSWHYYGMAVDFQTKDLGGSQIQEITRRLKQALPEFDVVQEATHIHVEIGRDIEKRLGLS